MSLLKAYREVMQDPYAGTGKATTENRQRAAAIEDKTAVRSGLIGAFEETMAQPLDQFTAPAPAPAPAPARPAAIPTDTETQQEEVEQSGTLVTAQATNKITQQAFDDFSLRGIADWFKTTGKRIPERGARLLASASEGAYRFADPITESIEEKIPVFGYSIRVDRNGLSLLSPQERGEVRGLFEWAPELRNYAQSLGVEEGIAVGDLADKPYKVVPFIVENVAASLPDMAWAAANTPTYIATRTNEIINDRLENDQKTIEELTVGDVAAAAVAATVEGTLERYATRALGRATDAATAGGRIAKQTALQTTTEGVEEGAAYLGGAAGTEKGVDPKQLGEQVLAGAIVGGGLGATVEGGKEAYEALPGTKLKRALDAGLDQVDRASPVLAEREAVRALDPNRDVAIDPAETVRPAGSAETPTAVQQAATAVTEGLNPPEEAPAGAGDEDPSGTDVVSGQQKPSLINAFESVLADSEAQFLSQLDGQDQNSTAVEQPQAASTFTAAVESMKTDLGLDAAETVNLALVENDTRLNRFKNALETAFGVNVHFVDFGDQLTTDSGKQLGAFNGYRSGDTILVGAKNADLIDTTWHELTHVLETRYPDVYQSLRDNVVPSIDQTVRDNLVNALNQRRQAEVGRDLSQQELDSELVAYVVGDLVRSPETLSQMFDSFTDPKVAKTFRDVLNDILQKLLAVIKGPQYIRERARLVEAQKSVTSAFAEFQKRETQKQMAGGVTVTDPSAADANTNFARRVKPPPTKTVKAYKLFRVDPKQPGKLFPLFVNANDPINMNEWLDAESGPSAAGGKVKSKIGSLAYRPGWHAGDLPIATHIGSKSNPALKKPDLRPDNQVWAEVELAADRDWQSVANQRGTNAQGQVVPVRAQITDQLPEDGFYRYKTNPNMTGDWLIGGSMKVNRVLSDAEVEQINRAAGTADLRREKPFDATQFGLDRTQTESAPVEPAAPVKASASLLRALPAKPVVIESDESASYKRAAGKFSRDIKITGEFAGNMFLEALKNNPQEMVDQYLMQFGREVNADLARELSPIYGTNPAVYSAFVHEGASKLSKMVFDRLLETAGPNDIVRFTAGGSGSGKGYALSALKLSAPDAIIFDGTMSKLATATTLIDKSLAAGVKTEIWYINADAMWALSNAFKRATTKGRTVPIEVIADAHTGAADVARILVEKYASTAPFRVVNNTVNGVTYGVIADVPRYNAADLKEKMYAELDRRVREEGFPVSLAIGFAPEKYSASAVTERPAERDDGAVREPVRRGAEPATETVREQPEQPARQAEQAEAVTPSAAPEAIPGDTKQQQAQSRFKLNIQRAERQVAEAAELSTDELEAIEQTGAKQNVPRARLDELIQQAVSTKRRFPTAQGWAPLFVRGVLVSEGTTPAEAELNWTPIPYKYNVPDGIGRAPQKLDEAWADKVSDEFYKLIKQIYARAEANDKNAEVILGHRNWYRNVTEVLRREFGAMGDLLSDLLGATSPNTPVDTNWRFSIDIMRRFVRGDFNVEMKRFANYIAKGGKIGDYPSKDKIAQISGKLYGMNSTNAMMALLNTWRQIHPGQAPKARNFALNLIGQSDMATIDVWAARMLRRAASRVAGGTAFDRIPPPAEKGVTGDWNSKATAVTGEFGFGARVMETVAKRLQADGVDITAPDLQAVAWFAEKELWANNNWTSAQGEGGSFEENIEQLPMERFISGWSVQQGEVVPDDGTSSAAQARVLYALRRDNTVVAARVMPTKGLYGGTVEQSFDTEWTVERGKHDPSLVLAEIAQVAKENNQYDIFVSKVLLPEENSANARPGVEIYFSNQRALNAAMPVLEQFTSQGVDGFTMAVDPRAEDGNYIGVRLQYIPEISMRWDEQFRSDALQEGFIERVLQEKFQQLNNITAEVSQMDGVAFAKTYQYDTIVVGKENYDAFIDRAATGRDSQTGGEVWFGQPVRAAVERAAARLNRDSGQVDEGGIQDASRPEPGSVGQFSRQLVELAANQDRRAPSLFGISETPTVLRAVGGPSQLLVMEPKNVTKVVNPQFTGRVAEEGGMRRNAAGYMVPAAPRIPLTVDELRAIPQQLADPVAIIKQESNANGRRYGYRFLIENPKGGYPVVAVLHPDVRYGTERATELVSVYPVNEANSLESLNRELNSKQLLYFNKGKATVLASKIGTRLPSLAKVVPTLAKNPGTVPSRTLPPMRGGGNFARRVAIPGQRFTLPARTIREKYFENLFENRMSRVEDVQEAVVEQGGTTEILDAQGNVVGSTDISTAAQRMRGAVRGRLDRFKKEVEIPLIEDAAKSGVNLDEVAQYLYAVYAPERNAVIQQRNPTQFATDGGSGMTNAEALQIVTAFQQRADFPQIARIAKRFQNITRMTQNLLLSEGLIEPQVIAQWKQDNPNYVPLRGFENFDEQTGNSLGVGSPGRLDPRNPFVKVAKGRETRAGQILENILKDYSDAVVLAEKNKVNRLLLQFVRDNPDPELWEINAPKVSRSYYKGGMTPLGYAQGTVRVAFEVNEDPGETIAVRVQGRPVFIRVKDPGMLEDMQMAGAIGSGDQAKLYFRVMSGMMQTLAKLRTTLSPAFVFIDAIRNTETGGFWNLVKYGPKTAAKAYARLFKSARIAWKAERDGTWQGNTDTITIREPGQAPRTITLKEAYNMYRADGGKVGYLDIKEIEDIQREIEQRFRAAQVSGSLDPRTYGTQMLDVVNKVEDFMLDAAGSVETAMRFATYMARLEAGANRQEATNAAKNVTVNFDRKGKWTPHLGLLYMFANANIQGTRATYNLIFKSGKAGAVLGGSLIALGYGIAQLAAGVSGDDDEPYWDKKLYKQSKLKNLVFFTAEGDTVTIPMAYGSGFFVNLGYALSDLQRGVPLAKVGAFMRDSFFTHFSPFGSMENPATFASPTLLDPFVIGATNMTEQGIPLMPDSAFEPGKPDSEKFWSSTRGTMFQQLSRAMNEATGGTQGYSGAVDVSPETMRYWYGFLTGGAGGFARDAADSIMLTSEIGLDTALEKNKIPILRSFYQQNTGKQNQTEFFSNSEEAVRALNEWKLLYRTEQAREEGTAERLREQRRLATLGGSVQAYKKALSDLRAEEVKIVDRRTSGLLTAAEAEERLGRIADKKDRLYTKFNRAFYRADPNTPE